MLRYVCVSVRIIHFFWSLVYLEDAFLESEDIVKLLGILIDKELTFEYHIKWLLKKANQKLLALMRVSKYMT